MSNLTAYSTDKIVFAQQSIEPMFRYMSARTTDWRLQLQPIIASIFTQQFGSSMGHRGKCEVSVRVTVNVCFTDVTPCSVLP